MPSATAVRPAVPFPVTIAAFPGGVAWIAHPTGTPPARKTTSMLLTLTSPATPAWGARAPRTDKTVRTCTSAAAGSGPVTQVEHPDAATEGAAGGAAGAAGASGRPEVAVPGPLPHPARPATAAAAMTLAARLTSLSPPGPGGDLTPHLTRNPGPSPTSMIGAARLGPRPPPNHAAVAGQPPMNPACRPAAEAKEIR